MLTATKRMIKVFESARRKYESVKAVMKLSKPTQGMSHTDTEEAKALIRSLGGELTVLLIEHDIDLVMDLSRHVIVMHQGAKLAEGPPEAVSANTDVQAAYFGGH